MIGKELAPDTALYKGLCICSSRGPEKTCVECLAYEGPSCGVMAVVVLRLTVEWRVGMRRQRS